MDFKEIQDLLKLVNRSDLTEVEIEKKDFKLHIKRKGAESNVYYSSPATPGMQLMPMPEQVDERPSASEPARKAEVADTSEDNYFTFRSPMIGTFYRSSSPETEVFVKVGDHVEKGQVVCIVEAMKLFNEIESDVAGKVVKILVENAKPVEYDQPLFLIDVNG